MPILLNWSNITIQAMTFYRSFSPHPFLITRVSQENLAGRIVAINGYPCCVKTSSVAPIFIAFLKSSTHNYLLDQNFLKILKILKILDIASSSMESP